MGELRLADGYCRTCRFSEVGLLLRRCHRQPPVTKLSAVTFILPFLGDGVFPVIRDEDWCGEYQEQPK